MNVPWGGQAEAFCHPGCHFSLSEIAEHRTSAGHAYCGWASYACGSHSVHERTVTVISLASCLAMPAHDCHHDSTIVESRKPHFCDALVQSTHHVTLRIKQRPSFGSSDCSITDPSSLADPKRLFLNNSSLQQIHNSAPKNSSMYNTLQWCSRHTESVFPCTNVQS